MPTPGGSLGGCWCFACWAFHIPWLVLHIKVLRPINPNKSPIHRTRHSLCSPNKVIYFPCIVQHSCTITQAPVFICLCICIRQLLNYTEISLSKKKITLRCKNESHPYEITIIVSIAHLCQQMSEIQSQCQHLYRIHSYPNRSQMTHEAEPNPTYSVHESAGIWI